jgi:hypothetical protein
MGAAARTVIDEEINVENYLVNVMAAVRYAHMTRAAS